MGDFRLNAVVGMVTLAGAVELLRGQGQPASQDSIRRWCRRHGVPLARIGRSIMVAPDSLTGYRYGR